MSTRLFLVCLHLLVSQIWASCPYIRTSVILAECVFDTSLYISLGAQIMNSSSVDFLGYYSLSQPNSTDDHLRNTLIYNLGNRWMFLVPFLIKCAHQPAHLTFTECQYTMRQTHRALSASEYMTTHLSVINITDLGLQSVLFLQPGLFDQNERSQRTFSSLQERLLYDPAKPTTATRSWSISQPRMKLFTFKSITKRRSALSANTIMSVTTPTPTGIFFGASRRRTLVSVTTRTLPRLSSAVSDGCVSIRLIEAIVQNFLDVA